MAAAGFLNAGWASLEPTKRLRTWRSDGVVAGGNVLVDGLIALRALARPTALDLARPLEAGASTAPVSVRRTRSYKANNSAFSCRAERESISAGGRHSERESELERLGNSQSNTLARTFAPLTAPAFSLSAERRRRAKKSPPFGRALEEAPQGFVESVRRWRNRRRGRHSWVGGVVPRSDACAKCRCRTRIAR